MANADDRIVHQFPDGTARVDSPSKSFLASGRPLSEMKTPASETGSRVVYTTAQEIKDAVGKVSHPTEGEAPDRTFRGAWDFDPDRASGFAVKVNMDKAKPIAQERVRQARKPKLEKMDADWFRAQEKGDSTKANEVANKKQQLRDATEDSRITGATTPEELKAAMAAIEDEIASME